MENNINHEQSSAYDRDIASRGLLEIMKRYVDMSLTRNDIEEIEPDIDWNLHFEAAWLDLKKNTEYSERLNSLEHGDDTYYLLVSNSEDYMPLRRSVRVKYTQPQPIGFESRSNKIEKIATVALGIGALISATYFGVKLLNKR